MRRFHKVPLPVAKPGVVEEFLSRPLESHDYLKQVPIEELREYVREQGHRSANTLWHNQLVCVILGMVHYGFLFYAKMGGGKTTIALELIRYRKRMGQLKRAIIVVPEIMHVLSWEEQIQEHAPDLTYSLILGTAFEKQRALDEDTDVVVINYAALQVFMSARGKIKKNGKTRGKQMLVKDMAAEFAVRFNFVAYDELHRVTDVRSLYYEMFRWISIACDFKYVLDGTPHDRDPDPLWGQFLLADGGKTLGENKTLFRHAFFKPKQDYFAKIKWVFDKTKKEELNRVIKHRSIAYTLRELRDVPRKTRIKLPVYMSTEGREYYKRILKNVREARGDYESMKNVFLRMRQCASGFISLKSDDSTRLQVKFRENPKIDRLLEFLRSKPDEKIMVFHEFTVSGLWVQAELTKAKIGHAILRGGMKDYKTEYYRFLNEDVDDCQVYLVNNALGSEAINPQKVCRRIVVYESPIGTRREQLEGRVERPGQNEYQFIHDLVVKGTVEEKILRFNKEGRDLLAEILSGDETLEEDE